MNIDTAVERHTGNEDRPITARLTVLEMCSIRWAIINCPKRGDRLSEQPSEMIVRGLDNALKAIRTAEQEWIGGQS